MTAQKKQQAIAIARRLGVLSGLEQVRFQWKVAKNLIPNRAVRNTKPDFPFPPLDVVYDTIGDVNLGSYYESGLHVAKLIYDLCKEYLPDALNSICEWGCGPGRVIRHMPSLAVTDKLQAFGSDYNEKGILWAQRNLPDVKFFVNGLAPPLSFDDNQFDCLYSTSVYTHLSEEMHFAWLRENVRVVRPGGIVIMTAQGDSFRHKLLPQESERYAAGQLVARSKVKEGSRLFAAFHSPLFMRNVLLKDHNILHHAPSPDPMLMGGQDVWVIRIP